MLSVTRKKVFASLLIKIEIKQYFLMIMADNIKLSSRIMYFGIEQAAKKRGICELKKINTSSIMRIVLIQGKLIPNAGQIS